MQILSKAFTILNTFCRLAWGYIYDKFGFKIPYVIICINQFICGLAIYFSSKFLAVYFIVVCFGVVSYSGHIILFPNLIKIKFGVDNSVIILGICGMFSGIACLMGPILTSSILREAKDYLIIYLIGVGPTIISLIFTFFIKVQYIKDKNRDVSEDKKITQKRITFVEVENSIK